MIRQKSKTPSQAVGSLRSYTLVSKGNVAQISYRFNVISALSLLDTLLNLTYLSLNEEKRVKTDVQKSDVTSRFYQT